MKEKTQQVQKNNKGVKTGFIWDELDTKYGIMDNAMEVAA